MTPSRDQLVLSIDLGTTGLKVGLVTLDGRLEAVAGSQLATLHDGAGGATQDAAAWWTKVSDHARVLASRVDPRRIVAVAIGGQYASIVPVDEHGQPTAPCVLWMDTRGGRHVRRAIGGPVAGYSPGAVLSFIRKTGGAPSPSGADGAGSLLHLQFDHPEVVERSRWLLEPVDYLALRFSGRACATKASMVGSWLTDNRSLEAGDYDARLLGRLGIGAERLAPLVDFGSVIGEVTPAAAMATGVPEGAKVLAGMPDLHAAALGAGTTRLGAPGHLALSTTSWISAPMPKKKTDVLHSIATVPGLGDGNYLIADNHEIGAKALEWFAGALGVPAPIDFDGLCAEAMLAPPGSGKVLFTPWLAGERSPVESHSARGGFHNLSLATDRPAMIRAVLEGVAYNSRWLNDYVERFAGRSLGPLRLLGGGARSDLWCQIHADVLGQAVEKVADPMHAQLRGAALLAGRSLGVVDAGEIDDLASIERRFEPIEAHRSAYDELFAEFPDLLKAQSKMFRRLQRRGASPG